MNNAHKKFPAYFDLPAADKDQAAAEIYSKLFSQDEGCPPASYVSFEQTRMWHPRFQFPCFEVPQWLSAYLVFHFHVETNHATMKMAVQALYHKSLNNPTD